MRRRGDPRFSAAGGGAVPGSRADDASTQEPGAGGDDWGCLVAMPNAGSIYWGDGGRLYLLIRREDLAARDLSRVRMALNCS